MTSQVVGLVSRAIVQHLDGNKREFCRLAGEAEQEYSRDRHLYLSIKEILQGEESECIS
jgi:hypothetical protein